MITIAINLTLIQFIVLPLVVFIFGFTIYFFLKSRKSLQETLLQANKKTVATNTNKIKNADKKAAVEESTKKERSASFKRSSLVEMEEQFAKMRYESSMPKQETPEPPVKRFQKEEMAVHDLKNTIAQQQKMLDDYLGKIEELENEGREELNSKIEELEDKVSELNYEIEEKNESIKELKEEVSAGQRMANQIEEVYHELEQLQIKMQALEKQAGRANNLAIELEDTKHAYEQVHKELARKHEKLEEVMDDNQRMRYQINELEDKLDEANLQRQQLQKKVQFLTDLNNDMQNIADTNKKLQTELRRIGELESMLNIMTEEREYLLKKRKDK